MMFYTLNWVKSVRIWSCSGLNAGKCGLEKLCMRAFLAQCWFQNFILKMDKNKKEDDNFMRKKTEEKENTATMMISVDGIGTVFQVKLKLRGELFD